MSQNDIVHQSFTLGWYSVLVCYVSQLRNIQFVDFYQSVNVTSWYRDLFKHCGELLQSFCLKSI